MLLYNEEIGLVYKEGTRKLNNCSGEVLGKHNTGMDWTYENGHEQILFGSF
jgi:hypothetical protein